MPPSPPVISIQFIMRPNTTTWKAKEKTMTYSCLILRVGRLTPAPMHEAMTKAGINVSKEELYNIYDSAPEEYAKEWDPLWNLYQSGD